MIMLSEYEDVRNVANGLSDLNKVIYKQGNVSVREILVTDRFDLKEDDVKEVYYSNGLSADNALPESIKNTLMGYTVLIDEKPEICFGINPPSLMGNDAIIWMLSSERIHDIDIRVVRHSRGIMDYFLSYYNKLINFVHVDNKSSIRWLKAIGAKFSEPEVYGLKQELFRKFVVRR